MAMRVTLTVIAVLAGWVTGVFAYVGLLYIVGDSPQTGDIHVGALGLGFFGAFSLSVMTWRLLSRLQDGDD